MTPAIAEELRRIGLRAKVVVGRMPEKYVGLVLRATPPMWRPLAV